MTPVLLKSASLGEYQSCTKRRTHFRQRFRVQHGFNRVLNTFFHPCKPQRDFFVSLSWSLLMRNLSLCVYPSNCNDIREARQHPCRSQILTKSNLAITPHPMEVSHTSLSAITSEKSHSFPFVCYALYSTLTRTLLILTANGIASANPQPQSRCP